MNKSNFLHALAALAIQTIVGLLTDNWWAGAALGTGFYVGREHAQREYKLGGALKVKPWAGFTGQSLDSILDWVFPLVACSILAVIRSNLWH